MISIEIEICWDLGIVFHECGIYHLFISTNLNMLRMNYLQLHHHHNDCHHSMHHTHYYDDNRHHCLLAFIILSTMCIFLVVLLQYRHNVQRSIYILRIPKWNLYNCGFLYKSMSISSSLTPMIQYTRDASTCMLCKRSRVDHKR